MSGKLQFGLYDFEKYGYMSTPTPSLNGGLYTGEEFHRNAPHRNFPVSPDTTVYLNENLQNGNEVAPYEATVMYPPTRKGNSFVEWKGLTKYEGTKVNWGPHNIYCPSKSCGNDDANSTCICEDICPNTNTKYCNKHNCVKREKENKRAGMSKYYYVV